MHNSIFLVFVIRINRSRSVDSILFLGAVFFMAALYSPWVFSANNNASQKSEWSVCMPFAKTANTQRQITAAALEREFAKFTPPEKEDISKQSAAYLELLRSSLAYRTAIEQRQWNSLKRTIDRIYAGQITAKKMMVDINNNGSLEHVVEFRSVNSFGVVVWNVVLDEGEGFHKDFLIGFGQPNVIEGELRVFNMETYIFDMRSPFFNSRSERIESLPFVIYRPKKSAMMKNSGISRYGAGPLCEFEIIHEQEKVR